MIDTQTEPQADTEAQLEHFLDKVFLVCPSMGWWRGMFPLPKDDVKIQIQGVELDQDRLTRNSLRLLRKDGPFNRAGQPWVSVFSSLEGERQAMFADGYIQFAVRGVYCVPKNKYHHLMARLYGKLEPDEKGVQRPVYDSSIPSDEPQSLAYRFNLAADEFAQDFPQIAEAIKAELKNHEWKLVEKYLPSPKSIRSRFYIHVNLLGLSNVTLTEAAELSEYSRAVTEMTAQAARARVQQAIETMVAEPRQQLADALSHLTEVARGGHANARSYGRVREAIEKLRTYEFLSNDDIHRRLSELETRLVETPAARLSSDADVRDQFESFAGEVVRELTDATAQEADASAFSGYNARRIDL